jgi:lysophospholipase L1-like esterase
MVSNNTPIAAIADAGIAAILADPTTATAIDLNNTFVPKSAGTTLGAKVVFIGDSITQGGSTSVAPLSEAPPTYALLASDGRWKFLANKGVAGENSSQILSRIPTDVVAQGATVCVVLAGTNDTAQGLTLATYSANMIAIFNALKASNIASVFCTLPPQLTTLTLTSQYNSWLRRFCQAHAIPLVDFHHLLVDTTTGGYITAYDNGDGVHPSYLARKPMGDLIDACLRTFIPPTSTVAIDHERDPFDLFTGHGLFRQANVGGADDGVGYNWLNYNAGTPANGVTWSTVTDSLVVGKMQRATMVNETVLAWLEYTLNPSSGFAVGDVLQFSAVITSDGGMSGGIQVILYNHGGPSEGWKSLLRTTENELTRAFWTTEYTVPAGTTSLDFVVEFGSSSGTGRSGVMDVGRLSCINLTTLGVNGL